MSELAIFGDIRHAFATRGCIDLQRVYHSKGFSPFVPSWPWRPFKVRQKFSLVYILEIRWNIYQVSVAQWARAPAFQVNILVELRFESWPIHTVSTIFFIQTFSWTFFKSNHISLILYPSTVVKKPSKIRIFANCMVLIIICPLWIGHFVPLQDHYIHVSI